MGRLHVCDLNADDTIDVIFTNSAPADVTVTVTASAHLLDPKALTQRHDALQECFATNTRSYDVTLEMALSYHGYDEVKFLAYDDTMLYSQPIVMDVYTLVSPCGTHGYCSSDHDPQCTSNQRQVTA